MNDIELCLSLSQLYIGCLEWKSTGVTHDVAALTREECEGEDQPQCEVQYVVLNHPNIKGTQICC